MINRDPAEISNIFPHKTCVPGNLFCGNIKTKTDRHSVRKHTQRPMRLTSNGKNMATDFHTAQLTTARETGESQFVSIVPASLQGEQLKMTVDDVTDSLMQNGNLSNDHMPSIHHVRLCSSEPEISEVLEVSHGPSICCTFGKRKNEVEWP